MTTEEPLPKTVRFIYTKSDDHKVIYANGIHGGITLQGEVAFDLFLEQRLATKAEVHSIKEDGTLGPKTKTEPEIEPPEQGQAIVIREKRVGVILSRDAAKNIAEWILKKVEQIDNVKQKTAVEEQDAEE